MKLHNNIFNKVPKKFSIVLATLAAVIIPAAVVMAGYGPNRQTFDWNKFDPTKSCTDPSQANGRCGSMDGPVFNSFTNNPAYGDERNFARVAPVVAGQSPTEANFTETANATPGQEYWVRTYVHNDANQNLNGANFDGPSVAHDTRVRVAIAEGVSNGVDVMTYVTAQNAKPDKIWDTASLANNNQVFSVNYVPGSAALYNGVHQTGLPLNDSIVSAAGTQIGYNQMNGELPGCFDYSAYVYVKVKVQAPAIKFDKLVRKDGEASKDWRNELHAKRGDRVEYLLDYLNTGSANANNIVLSDKLPSNMQLVPGTVKWIDSNRPDGTPVPDALLFDPAGVTVGNYGINGGGYIFFEATVKKEVDECIAKNVAFIRADNIPQREDDAVVIIDDCNPVVPVYTCDLLDANSLGNRKFSYTVHYTAKNATFKQVSYNFGDGSTPLLTDKTTVEHTYAADGTYTTKATVTFTVDGVDKTATSQACASTVSANTPKDNCPIPGKENLPKDSPECKTTTTPTTLPNTGTGSVAGIFAATSIAGAAAHQVFSRRRNSRGL